MKCNKFIKRHVIILPLFIIFGCSTSVLVTPQDAITPTSNRQSMISTPLQVMKVWTVTPRTSEKPVIKSPIITPRPTLTPDEAKYRIINLLQNNGGCELPCIFGITPGKTALSDLNEFMSQFGNFVSKDVYLQRLDYGEVGGFFISFRNENIDISSDFSYYIRDDSDLEMLGLFGYAMIEHSENPNWLGSDANPLYGDASFNQAFRYYMIPEMLKNYGQPSQILLAPFPDDPDHPEIKWHPFSTVFLYLHKGILIEYVSPRETVGNDYIGCPEKVHINLAVWSPDGNLSLKEIIRRGGSEINELNMDYFKPIEEVTSMSMFNFYQLYKNPEYEACIKTPIQIWQKP